MNIFEPMDFNFYVNATNVGNTVATKLVKHGMIGKIVRDHIDIVGGTKHKVAFVPLLSADLGKENVHVAMLDGSILDAEYDKRGLIVDFSKDAGEKIRVFDLTKHNGIGFKVSSDLISTSYGDINVKDSLVPSTDDSMGWEKGTPAVGSGVYLKVIEKDIFVSPLCDNKAMLVEVKLA